LTKRRIAAISVTAPAAAYDRQSHAGTDSNRRRTLSGSAMGRRSATGWSGDWSTLTEPVPASRSVLTPTLTPRS